MFLIRAKTAISIALLCYHTQNIGYTIEINLHTREKLAHKCLTFVTLNVLKYAEYLGYQAM